jgi:single-stranded DNA-binding protein
MNVVSLTGRVVGEPERRTTRSGLSECRIKLAVPRYGRGGTREPGVVYVDVTTFGLEARDLAERLSEGSAVGLSGRLDGDDGSSLVLIDQFDFL